MLSRLLLTGALLAAMSAEALAQTEEVTPPSGRLYRGLFGSGLQGSSHHLTFDALLSAGYDNNVLTADPDPASGATDPVRSVRSGNFQQGSAGLNYRLNLSRVTVDSRARASISDYSRRRQPRVRNYFGHLNASLPAWQGGRLALNSSIALRPFYYLPWLQGAVLEDEFLGPEPEVDETTGTFVEVHTNTTASASFSQTLTRRVTVSLGYTHQRSHSGSHARDFLAQTGRGGVSLVLTRGLGLRVGYGYSENRYQGGGLYKRRNIDFGLNYNRALSLTRHTRLSFNTGTTGIVDRDRTYYRLDADARLVRDLGRTWIAQLIYRRDVGFDDTFRQPTPHDTVSVGVAGLFSRRLSFQSSVGLMQGRIGLSSLANQFETYYGRSALTFGLNRILGLGIDYTYFQFRFDSEDELPVGMVRRGDRQRARVFLRMRTPLFSAHARGNR